MKLNDSISTYDVAEALQGETGKFEVTSPNGERYFVTCQPGHSIVSLEWAGSEPNLQPFLVRKVAQPVTTEGRSKRSAAARLLRRLNKRAQPRSGWAFELLTHLAQAKILAPSSITKQSSAMCFCGFSRRE
jgi:hypothetical protein